MDFPALLLHGTFAAQLDQMEIESPATQVGLIMPRNGFNWSHPELAGYYPVE